MSDTGQDDFFYIFESVLTIMIKVHKSQFFLTVTIANSDSKI